jgi:hypothetical protein
MSTENTIKANVEVSDNGSTGEVVKNIEALVKSLKAVQREAKSAMSAQPGGTAGSRGIAEGMMSGSAYGISRATGAGTGAAARDFAKESQGLSGLVRLYAIYAANLFAVSAAFRALSAAADTANMMKGLQQLSAQSGVSLANISKNLVTATDNAISFQEAMKATAQVTAAGLGAGTVEKIGKAAKGISAALGIDASDAVSRLSRGITKIEPELLDELGIFVKVDEASRAYALSIGKATASLTDFEKRQAFSIAVLKEFEDKFGNIKVDANPYNQLSASLLNLATTAGNFINTVLGPLASFLASSPTALLGILAAIGTTIFKQALPALGELGTGLRKAANDAEKFAKDKQERSKAALEAESADRKRIIDKRAEVELKAFEDAEAKYNALKQKTTSGKDEKVLNRVLGTNSIQDIKQQDLEELKKSARTFKGIGDARGQVYEDIANAAERAKTANLAYVQVERKLQETLKSSNVIGNAYAENKKIAADATEKATRMQIYANAAEMGGIQSLGMSYDKLKKQIAEANMGPFSKGLTAVGAGALAVGSRLLTAASALSGWVGAIVGAVAALSFLDDLIRSNKKQMDDFNSGIDSLGESLKNATAVVKRFSEYDPLSKLTVQALKARAAALKELSDGLEKSEEAFTKANLAASDYDNFRQKFFSIFNMDMKSDIAERVGQVITQGIILADPGPAKEAYEKAVKEVLGVQGIYSAAYIEFKLKNSDDYEGNLKKITEATKKFAQENQVAAARISETQDAFKATDKAYKELAQSLSAQNPLEKFATNLQQSAIKLVQGIDQPKEAFQNLVEIMKDSSKLTILPPEQFSALQGVKEQFDALSAAADKARKDRQKFQEQAINDKLPYSVRIDSREKARQAEQDLADAEAKGAAIAKPILEAVALSRFKLAGEILGNEIKLAQTQASIAVKKTFASVLLTGPQLAREEGRLTGEDIQVKIGVIQTTKNLIISNEMLRLSNQDLANTIILQNEKSTEGEKTAAKKGMDATAQQRSILQSKNPLDEQQQILKAKSFTQEAKSAAGAIAPVIDMIMGAEKQLIALRGQGKSNEISTQAKLLVEISKQAQDNLNAEAETAKAKLDNIKADEKRLGILDDIQYAEKQAIERQLFENDLAKQRLDVETKLKVLKKFGIDKLAEKGVEPPGLKLTPSERKSYIEQYKQVQTQATNIGQKETQDRETFAKKLQDENLDNYLKGLELKRARESNLFELESRNSNFLLSNEQKYRALSIEGLGLRKDLGRITQEEYILEKARLDIAQISTSIEQQTNEINQKATRELRDQQKLVDDINAKKKATGEISALEEETLQNSSKVQAQIKKEQAAGVELAKQDSKIKTEVVVKTANLANAFERINKTAEQNQKLNDLSYQRYRLTIDLAQQQINYQNQYLEGRKSVGLILESDYLKEKGILEQRQLGVTLSNKISEINKSELDATAALRTELDKLNESRKQAGADQSLKAQDEYNFNKINLENRIKLEADRAAQSKAGIETEIALQKTLVELKTEQDVLQAKQLEHMAKLTDATSSLAAVFGKVGDAIGKSMEQSQGFADDMEKLRTKQKADIKLAEKRWETEGDGAEGLAKQKTEIDAKYEKDRLKLDNKQTLGQIGNVKKLFHEKSFAYKAISAVETAIHVAKMFQFATELTAEGVMTANSVAGSMARAGAAGLEAIVKAYTLPPPLGFVTGAAMTAIIAGILGAAFKGGAKTSYAGFQMNTEQRQETQGTGSTYIADPNSKTGGGMKVETGAGVFGDSSEKVDSIRKGIKLLAENSVEGLSYDNKMLKALTKLSDAMTGAAQQIYSIPGLRQGGTSFGTQPGTSSGISGFMQTGLGKLVNASLLGLGNSIFGGKTTSTTSVQSAGIQLTGTFDQVINDTANSIKQYKDVLYQFHKSGGWFSSSKDWTEIKRETEAVQASVSNSIADIFKESKVLFNTIAEKAGISTNTVSNAFSNMSANIDIDVTKLTGAEVIDAINAAVGVKLDELGNSIFGFFEKYKKFGESFLDTTIRVVDANDKINQALTNIRGVNPQFTRNYDVTEALAKTSGGLDKFLTKADYFRENFLTEAEKLAPVQKAVDEEMSRLGFSSVKTTEQFKYLIQNFKLTDQASFDTYDALLTVAEGFKKVYSASKNVVAIENERAGLLDKIDQLTMTTLQLREKEIAKLDVSNRVYQRQIYAIEDQQAAAKAYQTALEGITSTLGTQITSLKDYKTALLGSSNSTLTAVEQYANAKYEVDKLSATILSTDTSISEADRAAAIGKLTGATDKMLGLSRELYASGLQYTKDFTSVTTLIDSVTDKLQTQKTDAEKSLEQLLASNTYLTDIKQNTKDTATLLKDYLDKTATRVIADAAASAASTTAVTATNAAAVFAGDNRVTQPVVRPVGANNITLPGGGSMSTMDTSYTSSAPSDVADFSTSSAPYSYVPIDQLSQQVAATLGITLLPAGTDFTATITTAVSDAVDTAMSNAATTIVDAIQDSTVAIVTSTDNNTQVIASTVVDTSTDQISANRLSNTAIASYKRSDLNLMEL